MTMTGSPLVAPDVLERVLASALRRGGDFAEVKVDPKDPDVVYVANTSTYRSTDGGRTFTPIKKSGFSAKAMAQASTCALSML